MTSNDLPARTTGGRSRSPGIKLLIVILLTIVMAAPLLVIEFALSDRLERAGEAAQDIAQGWGGSQVIGGPVLFVPYEVTVQQVVDGKTIQTTQRLTAALLPSTLMLDTVAKSEQRWRGIFPVPVYRASVSMRAQFDRAMLASFTPDNAKVLWSQAFVSILVSDVRGLAGNVAMQANDRQVTFEPANGLDGVTAPGIHAHLRLDRAPDGLSLATNFVIRGSRELSFAPLGRQTGATIRSDWADPSFFGTFLPSDRRIEKTGFDAHWTVPYLARGYGQSFGSAEAAVANIQSSAFGVRFYQPVDFYQLVQRSLKYGVLFIGLAFLVFFVAELIADRRLHAAQYTLIGAAQALFYLLLLSFAEHIGFASAYVLAAAATIILTVLYAASVFDDKAKAGAFFVVLAALYGLLYVILIQEDYALLIGALLLFFALAATMYATRRLDWSRVTAEVVA
jgi:inner membrane protein